MKKIFAFDLDETLNEAKQPVPARIAKQLSKLLEKNIVVIVSGGKYDVIENNLLKVLVENKFKINFKNLYLIGGAGSVGYFYSRKKIHEFFNFSLNKKDIEKVFTAFRDMIQKFELNYLSCHGERIENRLTCITYSAFGQLAPLSIKKDWDKDGKKRQVYIKFLKRKLGDKFEINSGGSTSIDITYKNVSKGKSLKIFLKRFNFNKTNVLFVGDKIYPGGNDYSVYQEGFECISTSGWEETLEMLKRFNQEI